MTITAVLWDVDDTLFDHRGAERHGALAHMAAEGLLGRYASADEAAAHWHEVAEHYVDRYLAGEFGFQDQRRERARAMLGKPLTDEQADEWFARYVDAYRRQWRAFPDVVPALRGLTPRYRHGVLSNNQAAQQELKLAAVGIRAHFEVLVCSEELGVAKPDPAAFHAACEALGLSPREVAYVGDRHDVDAAGADAAGLTGVWLDRVGGITPQPGVRRITGLGQLAALLEG
ncbi:HAD family hydrolase [Streptomyces sp. NPDC051940]|uniref:HAD family hydrolase n=1 Tax=Streptomyces sp. NPDC051940 TaxID=3155675 RepID=UPI00341A1C08